MNFFLKLKRKFFKKNKTIFYIDKSNDLDLLHKEIDKTDAICLDTEFDWRKTYFPNLSLIQISTKSSIFLIDYLKVKPKIFLKEILESSNVLKIFHSVRSDATIFNSSLKTSMKNVFDIQIAEKVINRNDEVKNYGYLVFKYTGLNLEKSETNSNWLKRPLTYDQINYAIDDVRYMFDIFFKQKNRLKEIGLFNNVLSESHKESMKGEVDLLESRLKRQSKRLNSFQKKIFIWRENKAMEMNLPPSYIFNSKDLIRLSKISRDDLLEKKIFKVLGDTQLVKDFIKSIF